MDFVGWLAVLAAGVLIVVMLYWMIAGMGSGWK